MSVQIQKFNLRKLPFSPSKNPLVAGVTLRKRSKNVTAGGVREMVDPSSGEISNAVIVEQIEVDETHFVKVFTAGIRAAFNLTLTGSKVFQAMLEAYQNQPMTGGFADSIYLHFFDGGLDGKKLDISERTYRRGLIELLENGFLYPRGENLFWVNPNMFFRGNIATFMKVYRKKSSSVDRDPNTVDLITGKTDKEVQDEI